MYLLTKCFILSVLIMIGNWFLSGACIVPGFIDYTPQYELSKMIVMITSLTTFITLGLKLNKYIARKFDLTR